MLDFKGKTITSIHGAREDSPNILIRFSDGTDTLFYHEQDCCEYVRVKQIDGDINDLIGSPLLMAEEVVSKGEVNSVESSTWTFYKFATIKGFVTISWIGESNGYYSESVDFSILSELKDSHQEIFREVVFLVEDSGDEKNEYKTAVAINAPGVLTQFQKSIDPNKKYNRVRQALLAAFPKLGWFDIFLVDK